MKLRGVTIEHFLYALALLLALCLRFARLGAAPLGDGEATLALQALQLAKGQPQLISGQPGYILFTTLLFFLFQAAEWTARFWPAIAGSVLVLAPLFFRNRLGKAAAVGLAFALAIDPTLVALSRLADSGMLALSFSLLGLGFVAARRAPWAGIFLALALLAGPMLWPLWLSLGLAFWVAVPHKAAPDAEEAPVEAGWGWGKQVLPWLLGTLFFAGTLFFVFPAGLGAVFSSLPAYLRGWGTPAGVPLTRLLLGLVIYQPLALLLGAAGFVRAWRSDEWVDRFLAVWWAAALLLALAYPAHQVVDLAWSAVPLWALAVRTLLPLLHIEAGLRWPTLGEAFGTLLVLLVSGLVWMSVIAPKVEGNVDSQLRLVALILMLVVLLLGSLLVGLGWSPRAARQGLLLGVSFFLACTTLAGSWRSAGLGTNPGMELLRPDAYPQEADLLMTSLRDFSQWNVRSEDGIDIQVVEFSSPALRWALRNFPRTTFAAVLSGQQKPSLVITPDQEMVGLAASYSGQDFVWAQRPSWSLLSPEEWLRWAVYREAMADRESIVLWVRSDLFPGAAPVNANEQPAP